MKKISAFLVLLGSLGSLFAQQPNNAYRLPPTPDMPEWATKLYRDDIAVNVFELDEDFEAWEKTYETREIEERAQWTDSGEEPTFEENIWEEYYDRWRHSVAPYIQPDGSLDFNAGPRPPKPATTSQADHTASWSLLGPTITYWAKNDNAAQPVAPWHANIYAIDVAPSDPNILYYGTETGALGKTTDKGLTWNSIGLNNTAFRSGVGAIAIHPTDPNIVYVGNNNGVYKTTDGGTIWTQDLNASSFSTNDIKINPNTPEEVLAAGASLRRRTAGPTWSTIISRTTYDVSYKPGDPSIAYALVKNSAGTLCEFYKSTDGGATFSIRSNGWIGALGDGGGRMTVTSSTPNLIYVVLLTTSGPRILRSSNAGESWILLASGIANGGSAPLAMDNGQGYYDLSISVSPNDTNQIIVATTTAYKSTDGGINYIAVGGYTGPFGIHPDIQEMITVGNDSWIATDGGINLSTDFWTSTANFSSRITGLTGTQFWCFAMGWNEDAIVGGRYHNGNTAWHENYPAGNYLRMGGGEQATGYINPGNSRMAYFSDLSGGRLLPTALNQNFGTFTVTKFPNENYSNMEWSEQEWEPRNYYTYYLGNANILWKTADNGVSFTALFTYSDVTAKVQHIEVSRTDPNTIYCTIQGSITGELWKTTDGGVNWVQCTKPAGVTDAQRRISNVTLSGTDANILWWCFRTGPNGSKIFKSIDGGTTWTNWTTTTLNAVTLNDMVHQLGTDGGVYLSGDFGAVYYRDNSLNDWVAYSTGLPAHLTTEDCRIKIQYKKKKLRMASNNGVWEVDLYGNSTTTLVQPTVDYSTTTCGRDTLQLESYSVVNGTATYQWSVSPAPQWISDANIRNPRLVLGSTAGLYSATLTVTDDNGSTSRTISNFINNLPGGNLCEADTIPGKSLVLDGSGDYAVAGSNLNLNSNTVTLTAWVKRNGAQNDFSGLVYARGGTTSAGLSITSGNALKYTWDDAAGSYSFNTGFTIPDNVWTHIALVITPTNATIYMNGVGITRTAAHPAEAFDTPLKMGYDNGTTRYFKGQIEEVTVWNKSLSQNEIRELMHLTLTPANQPNLVSYYQFDEPSGSANDKVSSRHAVLIGNATRQVSTCPVGKGVSARLTVTAGGTYTFGTTGLALSFPASGTYPNGELCASRINQSPDTFPNLLPRGRAYWIVNNYGTNSSFTQLSSLLFGDYETLPAGATPANFSLYKRSSFADGFTWGAAIDVAETVTSGVHGSVLFSTGNNVTSFSQLLISNSSPLPVELTAFDARLQGKNSALLNWSTSAEKNNKGFEVEWMPGSNGTFQAKGFMAARGSQSNYSFVINDLADGDHYFRLKQLDNDGTFQYSAVKTVHVQAPFKVSISPNPLQNQLTVQVFQEKDAQLSISLVNELGQKTELMSSRETAGGTSDWNFDLSKLPAGVYYCICKTNIGLEETIRVVKN